MALALLADRCRQEGPAGQAGNMSRLHQPFCGARKPRPEINMEQEQTESALAEEGSTSAAADHVAGPSFTGRSDGRMHPRLIAPGSASAVFSDDPDELLNELVARGFVCSSSFAVDDVRALLSGAPRFRVYPDGLELGYWLVDIVERLPAEVRRHLEGKEARLEPISDPISGPAELKDILDRLEEIRAQEEPFSRRNLDEVCGFFNKIVDTIKASPERRVEVAYINGVEVIIEI